MNGMTANAMTVNRNNQERVSRRIDGIITGVETITSSDRSQVYTALAAIQ